MIGNTASLFLIGYGPWQCTAIILVSWYHCYTCMDTLSLSQQEEIFTVMDGTYPFSERILKINVKAF